MQSPEQYLTIIPPTPHMRRGRAMTLEVYGQRKSRTFLYLPSNMGTNMWYTTSSEEVII